MSVDLKRLQSLAEAVGWKITFELRDKPKFNESFYRLHFGDTFSDYPDLTPIRKRLEQEYRKRAEQEEANWKLANNEAVCGEQIVCAPHSWAWHKFTRIADELAVKEPTMVENDALKALKDARSAWCQDAIDDSQMIGILTGKLIDLYERKEK